MTAKVVILGGGVIGLTTAYSLARAGVRVVVCDAAALGQEASWAGAGILPPSNAATATHPFDQLRALSSELQPELSQELRELTGVFNGYVRCGGIEIASAMVQASPLEWHGYGAVAEPLTQDALGQLEPALASDLGDAFHLPALAQLRNPRHLRALRLACQKLGVQLLEGEQTERIERRGSRILGVETSSCRLEADAFLVAAGAWSAQLLQPLGVALDVKPVRGQIVLLQTDVALNHVIILGAQYLVPRFDGLVLVGSTEEDVGFDRQTTAAGVHGLLQLALRLVPRLAQAAVVKSWAGLRPASRDGLPYLGRAPGFDNLYVCAGHFRAGLQLSTGSARLMTDLLLGRETPLSLEPFRLDRPGATT